jgi:chromate transporter
MIALAYGLRAAGGLGRAGWVQGLKVAAVAVVAQAVVAMARRLCPDFPRAAIAAGTAGLLVWVPAAGMQLLAIAVGAAAGAACHRWFTPEVPLAPPSPAAGGRGRSAGFFAAFLAGLVLLPWLARLFPAPGWRVADAFYRAGALVFGGGHVVLPLLQQATVARGWIGPDAFLAGYGAAQALPGPLFAFSAYLGALIAPGGLGGALLALGAIYLPAVLILAAALPQWERLRRLPWARYLLAGANAAVVGLLAAALYRPIGSSTITSPARLALAAAGFAGLQFGRLPPWLLVAGCAALGAACLGS